ALPLLLYHQSHHYHHLHSFPTRRSSDLHGDAGHHLLAFTALRTRTRPPLGPGTAPFTSSRLRSASACTTSRLSVVTFSAPMRPRSEEHTSELQSLRHLVCRLLLEKKKKN